MLPRINWCSDRLLLFSLPLYEYIFGTVDNVVIEDFGVTNNGLAFKTLFKEFIYNTDSTKWNYFYKHVFPFLRLCNKFASRRLERKSYINCSNLLSKTIWQLTWLIFDSFFFTPRFYSCNSIGLLKYLINLSDWSVQGKILPWMLILNLTFLSNNNVA